MSAGRIERNKIKVFHGVKYGGQKLTFTKNVQLMNKIIKVQFHRHAINNN